MDKGTQKGRAFEDEVLREQVRLALRHVPTMQLASFFVALVLCYVVRDIVPHVNIFAWLPMIVVVAVGRIVLYHRFCKVLEGPFDGNYWKNVYLILTLVSGINWGLSSFIIFPAGNPELISLFVLVIASLSAATTVSHSSIRLAPTTWAGPAMLLYAIRCLMEGGQFGYTVGSLIILYLFTILRYSFTHNNSITSAIALRFENLELLEEVQKVNDDLRQDIAKRKQAEDAVLRAKEDWERTFDAVSDLIVILDKDYSMVRVNRAMAAKLGFTPKECVGLRCYDAVHGMNEPPSFCPHRQLLVDGFEHTEEIHEERLGGYFAVSVSPLSDPAGRLIGSVHVARDITERKRDEEEHIRLAQAIEQIAEGIIVSDQQGVVQYVNPAFEQMSGFSQDEIIGCHVSSIDGGNHDRADYGAMWDGTSRKYLRGGCFTNKKKDGSLYQVEVTISPVRDKSGSVINYISVQRDVTREMALEDQLRQAQKMEAIGTLAGGIAHDFNNILGIIMGYMELAKRDPPENEKTGQYIKDALNACRRAKDLIRQILSFSRANDKTERLLLDIRPAVEEVVKFFKASLPSTIEIRQNISSRECGVWAHPTQIHQVLTNLCANAAQAMGETGGILEVSLINVDFDPLTVPPHPDTKPGPYVKLSVADTGRGMDSATLERIFDPYFTTKEAGKGTGLGLAVVHGIVKSHDGVITASSEVGKGTVFHVYLPRIDREPATLEEPEPPIPRGTERILLVDDEEQLVNVWQKALESLGYRVTTKTSCLEALELFRVHPGYFDLVITDYTMPHMNGIDLARQMMRIQPSIPVILCSGLKEGIVGDRTRGAGLRALLMKPLELPETAEIIRKVLDNK
jgi:PAS domain S-box-containing protein